MRLVECEDDADADNHREIQTISDAEYSKPKLLQSLDGAMAQILNKKDLSDNEKCVLYNQVLRKYLYIAGNNNNNRIDTEYPKGLMNNRDSLDMITQPTVKHFFESVREKSNADPFILGVNPFLSDISFSPPSTRSGLKRDGPSSRKKAKPSRKRKSTDNITKPCSIQLERWEPCSTKK